MQLIFKSKVLSAIIAALLMLPAGAIAQVTLTNTSQNNGSFPLLPGLERQFGFWLKIFTEYDSGQLVFHNIKDMSKIYEVINVGSEPREDGYIKEERRRIAMVNGVDIDDVRAQRGIKDRTMDGIKRSGRYVGQMKQILRDSGVPEDLAYLPMLESSYDNSARSSVGALGMWQFMRGTGKQYMRVDAALDERRDPIESTRAAAAYLSQAYGYLGNWPLAITSYNLGTGGMARAAEAAGSSNLVEIIQRYEHPYFGFAPQNFYAEFLVAVEIGKNVQKYFPGLQLDSPMQLKEVPLTVNASVDSVIQAAGMEKTEFLEWNPAIAQATRILPAGYRVKLPTDRELNQSTIEVARNYAASQPRVIHHRVKRGETLIEIARRYGASAERILKINNIRRANLIRAGSTLLVPRF